MRGKVLNLKIMSKNNRNNDLEMNTTHSLKVTVLADNRIQNGNRLIKLTHKLE